MSWSDQETTGFQESNDIEELKRNYANAELAYQSLKRDYSNVLTELSDTKKRLYVIRDRTSETASQFDALKSDLSAKTKAIDSLIAKNESYFSQLNKNSQTLDGRVKAMVDNEIERQKSEIIRMDRFTEYFPVLLSLIAFAAVLFFIFGM